MEYEEEDRPRLVAYKSRTFSRVVLEASESQEDIIRRNEFIKDSLWDVFNIVLKAADEYKIPYYQIKVVIKTISFEDQEKIEKPKTI